MHTKHPFITLHTQLSSSFIPSFNRSDPKFVDLLTTYSFYERVNERSLQIRGTRKISYFFSFSFLFPFFFIFFFDFSHYFLLLLKNIRKLSRYWRNGNAYIPVSHEKNYNSYFFYFFFFFIYSFIEISQNSSLQQSSLLDYKIILIKNAYVRKGVRVFTPVYIC